MHSSALLFVALATLLSADAFTMTRSSRIVSSLYMGSDYDYDLIIVGCGVGGHGAALHARGNGLKTAIFTGKDVGGTCVNRGCVPSKALLAASGRIREMKDAHHLKGFGITVNGDVSYDRAGVAGHAEQLANKVKVNLEGSLKAQGVDIIESFGSVTEKPHEVRDDSGKVLTAKNIILAPGSVPFVPRGITYVAIIGSGYIGLEFSDVYTALGSEVTFIEALDTLMPTFDPEIRRLADRLLLKPRSIDSRVGVFASEVTPGIPGKKPATIKMIDAKTKEHVETLEVDAVLVATGRVPNIGKLGLESAKIETERGFICVDEKMRVLDKKDGKVVKGLWCIGDANGKMMLAHAASAQGISAVENIVGRKHVLNHDCIPAACFTHPEIAMVGLTEDQAKVRAAEQGFPLGKSVGHFRANSKALAEQEGDGIAKVLYNKDTEEIIGVHIIGIHAADLIQECANAMAGGTTVREIAMMVHTHPTLSEVLDSAFKGAVGMSAH